MVEIKLPGKPTRLDALGGIQRLGLAVWGSEGAGKTRFLMSCPRPTIIMGFDRPMAPESWEAQGFDTKEVFYYNFGGANSSSMVRDVQDIVHSAVAHGEGTLAFDNAKVLWDAVSDMREKNQSKGALTFGEPNLIMKGVFGEAISNPLGMPSALNLVITNPATDEWVTVEGENGKKSGQRSGKFVPHWWGKTGYFVDAVLWLYRYPPLHAMAVPKKLPDAVTSKVDTTYWARPSKFFHQPELVGADIPDPCFARIWRESFDTPPPKTAWIPERKK